jgi:uncharacterized iron-regulated membrane protein
MVLMTLLAAGSSGRPAAIALPILIPVLIIAVVAGVVVWWRRRRTG